MSTIVTDTITGKSTATTVTIGSTPVVSASANSTTIRGEGSNQTSIQQGLLKAWVFSHSDATLTDSFNLASGTDNGTGNYTFAFTNNMGDSNGSGAGSVTDNTDRTATIHTRSTSSYVVNVYNQGGSAQDSRNRTMINGDLS